MSVANPEPPIFFSQRSPSPPSFSSPPHSPNHTHHAHTPVSSPPPQLTEDIDMSASATLQPTNHDREGDAQMRDSEALTNGHIDTNAGRSETPGNAVAVEVAAMDDDDDAMDTSPDSQGLVLPNGSADPQEASGIAASSPAPNGVAQDGADNAEQPPATPTAANESQPENMPPVEPPPPVDSSVQPPPPPPPPPPVEPVRSESDSSDDDDGAQPWHPIPEDTSVPDDAELKEIEASGEVSALDHEHWEKKAFTPLDEPEYAAGASGRIEWTIPNYNGTREKPNRELVMKSPPVTIGGYEWQIKFYPKGNDSDYLSVYVECLSVGENGGTKGDGEVDKKLKEDQEVTTNEQEMADMPTEDANVETQHAPLPLLDSKTLPKRKSVAAQVSVVMYNPTEPRVNYSRTCLHRFCSGSPDWGWTRFHGPYYDIPHRIRGQRQALLRDDKLAFTGYIRIVYDETNCLWEHPTRESNPWDSFAMTGLQALTLGEGAANPGGNMISAVASWMLFKPFRQFLYRFQGPDPVTEPFVRPKPLVCALQKVLFMLRTQIKPGVGPVTLDDVLDAFEWYGIQERLDKLDVMEVWEILRLKMEDELRDTPYANIFNELFGPARNYASGVPSYRAPVLNVNSMQDAVNNAADLTLPGQPLPQLLTIELERQYFDAASRSYVKLLNKVSLDDHIIVQGTAYTLYGFVAHKQTLQSYLYYPVIRPEGPNSKWYTYTDGKDENQVKCLTRSEAVDKHQGKAGPDKVIGNDAVAYIVMYVRDDVAEPAFNVEAQSEDWKVPEWLRNEVAKQQNIIALPPIPPPAVEEPKVESKQETEPVVEAVTPKTHTFQVIDSKAFLQHEGPGIFDAYDPKWQLGGSDLVYSVELTSADGCQEIRDKLAAVVKDVQDPRQIKFWFLASQRGTYGRPMLFGTGKIEYSSGSEDHYVHQSRPWSLQDFLNSRTAFRIWIHVVDVKDLPGLPKEEDKIEEQKPEAETQPSPPAPEAPSEENTSTPPTQSDDVPVSEDSPMSEPDAPPLPEVVSPVASAPATQAEGHHADATTVEVEVEVEPVPNAETPDADVVISNIPAPADTEMGGTQDDSAVPPPPPPPSNLQVEPVPPPPPPPVDRQSTPPPPPPPVEAPPQPAPVAIPDEVYFFLKLFDPEKQTLESRGSHIAQKTARVDTTLLSLLELPSDKKIDMFEEADLTTTHPIRSRRSFAQNDLHNMAVIIVTFPLNDDQRNALAARAAFADPQPYLVYRAQARNFPSRLTGHFTYNHFSSQYYKGEIKNGHRHGHGYRIYHSGATYQGSFRLSQRYGHGLYTFQNGDTYDGEWVANQQHGTGTFVEASTGNTYVGGWRNDKKFGEGVTHWKNAQETERLCRICWEESADAVFYDCGHVVACLQCARRVDNCPVCRKRVLSAIKLYYVA